MEYFVVNTSRGFENQNSILAIERFLPFGSRFRRMMMFTFMVSLVVGGYFLSKNDVPKTLISVSSLVNSATEKLIPESELTETILNEASLSDVSDSELGLPEEITNKKPQWQSYQVRHGDTLSRVFQNLSLPVATMYKILRADKQRLLHRLEPGQIIDFLVSSENVIQELKTYIDLKHSAIFKRFEHGYECQLKKEKSYWVQRQFNGKIQGSFYESARKSGLSVHQIKQISQLFQNKLNFKRDFRSGDQFKVLLKQEEVEGQKTDLTEVLAVEFSYRNGQLNAYLNPDDHYFYDCHGNSMSHAFLRLPFYGNFRLSSAFNLDRKHPVTLQVRPHHGVDFAMPVGTPIIATGDGVVAMVGSHPIAGKYLVLQHGKKYSTRYLHLDKVTVKTGESVQLGNVIAYSGNTGRTTGAHIHYEFRVDNRPVDPMRVNLPMAKQLMGEARESFLAQIAEYQLQLNQTA